MNFFLHTTYPPSIDYHHGKAETTLTSSVRLLYIRLVAGFNPPFFFGKHHILEVVFKKVAYSSLLTSHNFRQISAHIHNSM